MLVRVLIEGDIGAVMKMQEEPYLPALAEPPSAVRRKMALFPEGAAGCFRGTLLTGYLFCRPWTAGTPAPLSSYDLVLPEVPMPCTCTTGRCAPPAAAGAWPDFS